MSRINHFGAVEVPLPREWADLDRSAAVLQFPTPQRLQAYLDALPIAGGLVDCSVAPARMLACNAAFAHIFDAHPGEQTITSLLAEHKTSLDRPARFLWSEPTIGGRHFRVHVAPIAPGPFARDLTLVTLIDCTAATETERSLRFEMLHDSLTGLPNRLAFTEAIDDAIEAGESGENPASFAVIALNLTRFSRVNESIGSLAGDELIITVARRMVGAMRSGDMLARLGADEFGVLIRLVDGPGDALHAARRLQEALALPLHLSDLEIRIDCAIGLAVWHEQAPTSHDIIRNAQFALKRSKNSRRIEVYEPGEAGRAQRRFSLETELRRAIDAEELSLAFQPLVDLDTGQISGFEALARWQHPDRGAISPIEFITVAEEAGLIVPLGRWVIECAAETLRRWDDRAGRRLPIYFGVNVSPVQLARDTVATVVEQALARHGIDGQRMTLELTESSIVSDPARAAGVLNALKALSCRIAMDDFGTGFSSLASLQRLPIDVLKIDRQFVTGMLDDRDSTAIIRAILSLANALGMSTIAEGIESRQAASTLAALGCRVGQGFYFSRPMAEDVAFDYLMKGANPPR